MSRFRRERLVFSLALSALVARAESSDMSPSSAATHVAPAPSARPPARVFLTYERQRSARSCISPEQLGDAVEVRLGRPVFVDDVARADLIAELHAARVAGRFVIEMLLLDRQRTILGRRQLATAARHCSALDDSLALVVSLAADLPTPAAPEASTPAVALNATPLQTPLAIPADTEAPRLGVSLEPRLGLGVLLGPAPSPSVGLELGVTLRAGHFWPLLLRGGAWLPSSRRSGPERGARFTLRSLELGVCPWEGTLAGVAVQACGLEWLAHVDARGFGFDQDQHSASWLVSLGAGLELRQAFGPAVVSVGGELLAPLVRRRYFFADVSDITTLHDEPWLFGLFRVGVGLEF